MNYSEVAQALAAHIRDAVRPQLGKAGMRTVSGTANSGDATFNIDEIAEQAVVNFINENALNVAYYTEDAGLREFGSPEATLIIDPIDGSRGAIAGFECCVVSVAIADFKTDVCMRDVRAGCIYEIKEDRCFVCERGQGVKVFEYGHETAFTKSDTNQIEKAGWCAEITARPATLITGVLGEAIDKSSVRGGFFILNSTAYALTRLVTGQLSAVIDVGGRLLKDIPNCRESFMKAGCGTVLGLFPYDFAAAALIAEESGCKLTDAWGISLDDVRLLDSSESNIQTIVAACNPELHSQFMNVIENGMEYVASRSLV